MKAGAASSIATCSIGVFFGCNDSISNDPEGGHSTILLRIQSPMGNSFRLGKLGKAELKEFTVRRVAQSNSVMLMVTLSAPCPTRELFPKLSNEYEISEGGDNSTMRCTTTIANSSLSGSIILCSGQCRLFTAGQVFNVRPTLVLEHKALDKLAIRDNLMIHHSLREIQSSGTKQYKRQVIYKSTYTKPTTKKPDNTSPIIRLKLLKGLAISTPPILHPKPRPSPRLTHGEVHTTLATPFTNIQAPIDPTKSRNSPPSLRNDPNSYTMALLRP